MDAANTVDWSMGSYASRLADWGTAVDIGRRVSGPGVPVPSVERARLREDMAEIVPRAEGLIRASPTWRSRGSARVRGSWRVRNGSAPTSTGCSACWSRSPSGCSTERPTRAEFKRKALGAQTGALMGYVARKVLGQYDVFLPPDDEGLLYFVGPNIVEAERRFSLPPKDFRLWIAIHEVTHRVQFGSATWLRGYLSGQVDDYLGSIQLDSSQLMNQLRRAAEEARSGVDWRGMGGVFLLLSPEQREMFMRMQAMMSLLEGHASFVMNEVARDHVQDVDRMRRALSARRQSSNLEKTLQRAIGFEQKIRQYDTGERFVRTIVERAGMSTFNLVWRSADDLPTIDEIGEPDRWLARVGG